MRTVLIWEGEALTPDANPRIQVKGNYHHTHHKNPLRYLSPAVNEPLKIG